MPGLIFNCLTVSTDTLGGSWTGHPLCPGEDKVIDQSCTGDILEGTNISIIATPDNGYVISEWSFVHEDDSQEPTSLSVSGDPSISQTGSFFYFSILGDVTIIVSFAPKPCQLTLSTTNNNGCIQFLSPNDKGLGCVNNAVATIDSEAGDTTDISVQAIPNSGYSISGWLLDGVAYNGISSIPSSFSTLGFTTRSIAVSFTSETTCIPEKELSISAVGNGSLTVENKLYCDGEVLNIVPIPSAGWIFNKWEHDGSSGITELSGNVLQVVMDTDRTNIKAIFKAVDSVATDSHLFYCSSETNRDNIVSFNFTNTIENPSTGHIFYFRVIFYSDSSKTKILYTAFSLIDNKRWFLNNDGFSQLNSNGLLIVSGDSVSIVYDPEILPQQITESQKTHPVNDVITYEKPLVCGVKYFVEIEAYELSTNSFFNIETVSMILDCNKVDSYYWNYNRDKNNWLCSGQGKMDLQVSSNFGQSINPSVSSNIFGVFQIVWQGRRINENNIYSAKWDFSTDILYSSGQGLYDELELTDANYPIILSDHANNFYITGHVGDKIRYKSCALPVQEETSINTTTSGTSIFERFCYPKETNLLGGFFGEIKARIYQEDIDGSLVINDEKVVSVVSKKSIRLDIDGVVGAYAVRVRNIEDAEWGDWINIDGSLYYDGIDGNIISEDDILYDAFKIDNSRFIVPWDINSNNGLRRICCQVLTLYGITNTFCLDLLANFDVPQHVFKFYTKNTRLPGLPTDTPVGDEFPTYKGKYVLSVSNATELIVNEDGTKGAVVYFEVIFSKEIYKDETNKVSYVDNDLKFNIVQQGINDLRKQNLNVVGDNKTFWGSFNIYKEDGVFNKDGSAFIEIILPETKVAESCGTDNTDNYNIVNTDLEEIANIDLSPEEAFQKYQSDQLSKALDINSFKQKYDKDDINFKFGNPGYYKD